MPIIIDGHNLLWLIQGKNDNSEPISDIGLCHILSRYCKMIGDKGELVFDGTGPRDKSGFESLINLDVFFAGITSDADTVIEHKIKANTAPRRLTVVSSDRRLRQAARTRKAVSVKSDIFWDTVKKQLGRQKKSVEPTAKRSGLSQAETNQWLEFFGLEQ